jgi:hypothetical protein
LARGYPQKSLAFGHAEGLRKLCGNPSRHIHHGAAQWCFANCEEFDGYGSIATSKRGELAEDESVASVMMVTSAQRGGPLWT